jgi:hypothetical protein
MINEVQNKIDFLGLGKKIIVRVAPTDIRFTEATAAEAKVLIGLKGAVLLVWGNIVKSERNTRFNTKFSYEFGMPSQLSQTQAKKNMDAYLSKVMKNGLASAIKMDIADFSEQTMPTVFFILGLSTLTLSLTKESEEFFNGFKELYHALDTERQKRLSYAFKEVNDLLVQIHVSQMPYLSPETSIKELERTRVLCEKILEINPNNYLGNNYYAYILDLATDPRATFYNEIAINNAPAGEFGHVFNEAYFSLRNGNYALSISKYESIPNEIGLNIGDISNYLDKEYRRSKNPAFKFADGYVQMRWENDTKIGKASLEYFLKIADNNTHAILIEKAESILNMQN